MARITEKNLAALADTINVTMGTPREYFSNERNKAGELLRNINVGHYHISYAYGGASLEQTVNAAGGVRSVFGCGHIPRRELYERMHAFLAGVREAGAVASALLSKVTP